MRYLLWIILICLVTVRFFSSRTHYSDGQKLRIRGQILSEPIQYDSSQAITLANLSFYLPKYPEIYYGDKILVEGEYAHGKLKKPKLIEQTSSSFFLYQFRKAVIGFFQKNLPEPYSSLVAGVTLGSKASIPENFWQNLKTTGTAHVVVASGMNVTLVAAFVMSTLLVFMKRTLAIPIALIGIWVYVGLSGFDAPLVRSAIMGSIALSSQAFGRLSSGLRSLFMAALLMLIVFPDWLYDVGFMLSFAATLSLILFEAKCYRLIKRLALPDFIRKDFSTSLAAQFGVLPILFLTFGNFSLIGPLVNSLILWTIAPITIVGGIAGVAGVYFPILGRMLLLAIYPLAWWFVAIIDIFS